MTLSRQREILEDAHDLERARDAEPRDLVGGEAR